MSEPRHLIRSLASTLATAARASYPAVVAAFAVAVAESAAAGGFPGP